MVCVPALLNLLWRERGELPALCNSKGITRSGHIKWKEQDTLDKLSTIFLII